MFRASLNGHVNVVRLLLEVKADKDKANNEGYAALDIASRKGQPQVVQLLLQAKAETDSANIRKNYVEVVQLSEG